MNRSVVIAELRDRVNAVRVTGEAASFDTPFGEPLRTGELHEWFGGATGAGWIPAISVVAGLAILALARGVVGHLVWIGRAAWPCPLILDGHRAILAATTLIDPPDIQSRLWIIDNALRSSARIGVIADGRGLTLPHTRRLQLAASVGGGLCLLLRQERERSQLSAAATRWTVTPCPSQSERPRWTVAAIRNKHRPATECRADVEWDDAAGLVRASSVLARGTGRAAAAI